MKRVDVIHVENAHQLLVTIYDLFGAGFKAERNYFDYEIATRMFENQNVRYVTVERGRIKFIRDLEFTYYIISGHKWLSTAQVIDFADLHCEPSELFSRSILKDMTRYDWLTVILTMWAIVSIYYAFKIQSIYLATIGGTDLGLTIATWVVLFITKYMEKKD